ncbi:MAG: hypothetical protein ABIP97_01695 [Chthoniobacterales bacterium]
MKYFPILLAGVVFLLCLCTIPAWWCGRHAQPWFQGDQMIQKQLADAIVQQTNRELALSDFPTGEKLFAGEWMFGTYMMNGIGLCQMCIQHPEEISTYSPVIEQCIRQLLSDRVREFDTRSWHNNALTSLENGRGHAAYLGYFNVLLGLYRQIKPANEFSLLNDQITAALIERTTHSPNSLIETYPNEWYAVDNCPVIASIAIHGRVTNKDYSALLQKIEDNFTKTCVDPKTGLLIQSINADGTERVCARGSGSSLGIFFLHYAYPELGRNIYSAIKKELATNVIGFGLIREYPRGSKIRGDIDSGPILFGFGFSATGFSISGARIYGDYTLFSRLYACAYLSGAPINTQKGIEFVTAGPLGNAILFAMLTAPKEEKP